MIYEKLYFSKNIVFTLLIFTMRLDLSFVVNIPSGNPNFTLDWYPHSFLNNILKQKNSSGIGLHKPEKLQRVVDLLSNRDMKRILRFHRHPKLEKGMGKEQLKQLLLPDPPKEKFGKGRPGKRFSLEEVDEDKRKKLKRTRTSKPQNSQRQCIRKETDDLPSPVDRNLFDDLQLPSNPILFDDIPPPLGEIISEVPKLGGPYPRMKPPKKWEPEDLFRQLMGVVMGEDEDNIFDTPFTPNFKEQTKKHMNLPTPIPKLELSKIQHPKPIFSFRHHLYLHTL